MTINARSEVDVVPESVLKLVRCHSPHQDFAQGLVSPFDTMQVAKSSGANYSVHKEQARKEFASDAPV